MQNAQAVPNDPSAGETTQYRRRWHQFSIRALLVVTTATAILVWAIWIAWPNWMEYRLAQSLRMKVLDAPTSAEKGEAYEAMTEELQPQSLKRLVRDPDAGIALKSAYALSAVGKDPWTPQAAKEAQDFAKLLSTRASLDPPSWWIQVLSKRESFGGPNDAAEVTATREGKDLLISAGDQRVRLSSTLLKAPSEDEEINACIAAFDNKRAYVAMSPIDGSIFPLVCVGLDTGQILWKADVWAVGFDNVREWSGPIYHAAEIKVQGNLVAVWGDGIGGSYVEAFDVETGDNQLRFCTEYWFGNH